MLLNLLLVDLNFLRGLLFCLRLSLITGFTKCEAPLYVILRLIWVSVIFYIFIIIRIWWQLLLPFIPHNKLFILLLQWQWLFRIGSRFLQILIWLIYLFKFLLLIIMLNHRLSLWPRNELPKGKAEDELNSDDDASLN